MSKRLILIGASGHGKVVADIAKKIGYTEIYFLDDNDAVKECGGYKVIGKSDNVSDYTDCDFIVSIGNSSIRENIQKALEDKGLPVVSLIHPNAVIGENVEIGIGTVVMAGAVVNSGTRIGKGCIINTSSSVDHDCIIEDFVHVSVGVHIAGTVRVGMSTWIGAGATVVNNIEIIDNCMIGAGAVVVGNIKKAGTYIGVPARRMDT